MRGNEAIVQSSVDKMFTGHYSPPSIKRWVQNKKKEQKMIVLYYPFFHLPSQSFPSPNSRTFSLQAGVVFVLFAPPPLLKTIALSV